MNDKCKEAPYPWCNNAEGCDKCENNEEEMSEIDPTNPFRHIKVIINQILVVLYAKLEKRCLFSSLQTSEGETLRLWG